jgi:hypothetical protein
MVRKKIRLFSSLSLALALGWEHSYVLHKPRAFVDPEPQPRPQQNNTLPPGVRAWVGWLMAPPPRRLDRMVLVWSRASNRPFHRPRPRRLHAMHTTRTVEKIFCVLPPRRHGRGRPQKPALSASRLLAIVCRRACPVTRAMDGAARRGGRGRRRRHGY